jgi:hypothetical protein
MRCDFHSDRPSRFSGFLCTSHCYTYLEHLAMLKNTHTWYSFFVLSLSAVDSEYLCNSSSVRKSHYRFESRGQFERHSTRCTRSQKPTTFPQPAIWSRTQITECSQASREVAIKPNQRKCNTIHACKIFPGHNRHELLWRSWAIQSTSTRVIGT